MSKLALGRTLTSFARCLSLAFLAGGCGDAVIGYEPCSGVASCDEKPETLVMYLDIDFVTVPTATSRDLPVVGTVSSPCAAPCAEPIKLFRAGDNAAWTVSRAAGPPTLKLLDVSGFEQAMQIPLPDIGAQLESFFVSSDRHGHALAHMQWRNTSGSRLEEVALLRPSGDVQRQPLSSKTPLPGGAITAPAGFLLFAADEEGSRVRRLDEQGQMIWQQARFPNYATQVGTSAVALDSGFKMGASDGQPRTPQFGLLSLDAAGTLLSFGITEDSTWRGVRMLPLGANAYAFAAQAELQAVIEMINTGNIDIVVDRGSGTLTGFRLKRQCFFELKLNGFSADAAGNLYVSSITGEHDAPRGLLCELPVGGTPRCFQGQPQQLFGEIVATGAGSLFVASGQEILRVQLPP